MLIGAVLMSIPLAGAWAIWEGNAGIASASDFPGSGMYAKSDMFPRNTIVEIQNLETDSTVRAVITGASGVPGLVAVLSPDTAAALNIRSGSVCRVRIRIPTAVSELPAEGTVESEKVADPDVDPAAAVAARGAVDPVVPLSSIAKAGETAMAPVAEVAPVVALAADAPVPVEPAAPVEPAVNEAPVEPAASVEPTSPVESVEPAEPVVAETAATPDEGLVSAEASPVAPAEILPLTVMPDTVVADESAGMTSAGEGEIPAESGETVAEHEDTGFVGEEPVIAAEEAVPADTALADAASEALSAPVAEEASPTYYEEPGVMETDVALVPAEPNPPVSGIAEPAVPAMSGPSIVVTSAVSATGIAPSIEAAPPTTVKSADISLPYIETLEKGKYYVQIASYTDPVNARKTLDAYRAKYPMVVKRTVKDGKKFIEVLIGPVHKDEYGAVVERFHMLGFKDAIARKGK